MRPAPASVASVAAAVLMTACVAERAGYDDVRALTAERLGSAARWHAAEQGKGDDVASRAVLDQPLDADAAARLALANSASLQASFERLGVARAEFVRALRLPNPHVGGAIRYGEERPDVEVEAMINVTELLFVPLRNGAGRAGLDAAALEVSGDAVNVAHDARAAFYEYQLAERRLELSRTTLGTLWAASEMATRMEQAGNVTELEAMSERAAYEEERLAHARAEANLLAQREAVNRVLGLFGPAGARWTARPELPEPEPVGALVENVESRAVAASLDLAATKKRYERAARRANVARTEGWVPELHAGVSAERAEQGWGIGPAAEVELPLFYQGQGETDAALAELSQERQRLTHTAVQIRAEARGLAARLQAAAEGERFYANTVLPLKQRIVEETQLQYNAMQVSVFQLLMAKRDEIAAARRHLDLFGEYWALRNELERLLAGKLGPGVSPAASAGGAIALPRASGGH